MKHIFIINPVAGKNKQALKLIPIIKKYFKNDTDYEIRITEYEKHAIKIAKEYTNTDEQYKIFACGGDGTLCEVVNGIFESNNVEVGVIPCGSGNDYLRSFGKIEDFSDINELITGFSVPVEMIKCNEKYALNICSIGIDAQVAHHVSKFKKLPLISGSMAYNLALVMTFFGKIAFDLDIIIDNIHKFSGKFLISLAAAGKYYGGGFKGAPNADPSDGMLDFMLVKKIGRLKILPFLTPYKKGEHEKLGDLIKCIRGKHMVVKSKKNITINMDGECMTSDMVDFSVIPSAIKFILPAKYIKKYKSNKKTGTVYKNAAMNL